jgi:hypothetical protein
MQADIKGKGACHRRKTGRLDGDDLGAEVTQKHRRRWRRQDMAEIDNPDSFQRNAGLIADLLRSIQAPLPAGAA